MCYRVSTIKPEKIRDYFKVKADPMNAYFHLSGHAHKTIPVITSADPDQAKAIQWGLKPFWPTTDFKQAIEDENRTLNTMAEYAFRKLPFEGVLRQERCLVLLDGFYEFRHELGTKKTPDKTPYYIYMPDHEPFAVPAVHWFWGSRDDGEFVGETVSLLTTKANERMSFIHNSKSRMPAIMDREGWDEWLDSGREYKQPKPYRDGVLQDHAVANFLKKGMPDPDRPETQLPISSAPAEQVSLF